MKSRFMMLAVTLVAFILGMTGPVGATPAADPGNTVLILGSTVDGGFSSVEAVAAAGQGFTVEVADSTTWLGKSQADFASYQAIILGDPDFATTPTPLDDAVTNIAVWGPTIDGNVIIIGTDPAFHSVRGKAGATVLTEDGIAYAADIADRTGAYITLSGYYLGAAPFTPVPVLDPFGMFTVEGISVDNVQITAAGLVHPALVGLTNGLLSNWGQSTHEPFDSFDPSFDVLVIELSSPLPYILARDADPFVAFVAPDPDNPDDPVEVFAIDPGNNNPLNMTIERLIAGGEIRLACCTFPAIREFAKTNCTGKNLCFDPKMVLDVGEQVGLTDGCQDLRPNSPGGIGIGEFVLKPWQRVLPNPELTDTPVERELLYEKAEGDALRRALEWGVCLLDTGETRIDGVTFTEEAAEKVVGYPITCAHEMPSEFAGDTDEFLGLTIATSMDPTEENFPFGDWMTGECDRSGSGRRSSRIGFLVNGRYDFTQNPAAATVGRSYGDLAIEVSVEQGIAAGENPLDPDYIEQLDDLAATLANAHAAANKARKAVKKGGIPLVEFQSSITLLDEFVCNTFDLPQRDSNVKAMFAGRGMATKFMQCTYEQHADGIMKDDCLINPGITESIFDPDYEGDCPVL